MGVIIPVSEKDIFYYVFQPEILSEEKIKFIAQDKSLRDKILYYKELWKSVQEPGPDEWRIMKIKIEFADNKKLSDKEEERDNGG